MTTYFTADTHFGHANILKYCNRPFDDVAQMNATLHLHWNSKVKAKDDVWVLGDFSFLPLEQTEKLARSLNGNIHLLLGNHDKGILRLKSSGAFASMHEGIFELPLDMHRVVLCHYPMLSWNRSFHGSYHLHGHTHGTVPFDPKVRRLDVGVDCHDYTPISWDEVDALLADIPTHSI